MKELRDCSFCSQTLFWCGIPWSRKTKHEACLILHRVPWGQEVSLLPSWRLWVLYNSIHKGLASHSPVINKWAAVQAKAERGLSLSCHHTCFHIHWARLAQHEGWLVVSWTPGKASHCSCLVCLIFKSLWQWSAAQEHKKQLNSIALSLLVPSVEQTGLQQDIFLQQFNYG